MEQLMKELVRLQILLARWVSRNTHLRCITHRDMDRILLGSSFTVTLEDAAKNLKKNALDFKDFILMDDVLEVVGKVNSSDFKKLRFGMDMGNFKQEEKELTNLYIKEKLDMLTDMLTIKDVSEMIGVTETAIKQACQQERILNTTKNGTTWLVSLNECRKYWNKK